MIQKYYSLKELISMYEKWEELKNILLATETRSEDPGSRSTITIYVENGNGETTTYLMDHMMGNFKDIDAKFRIDIAYSIDYILDKLGKEIENMCKK